MSHWSCIVQLCEERTSRGIETKHGQSSIPFLSFKPKLQDLTPKARIFGLQSLRLDNLLRVQPTELELEHP
jgi:hypothetical protein